MRLFLAIPIDDEIRTRIAEMQARLIKIDHGTIRWDNPDKFHLTVKFIGDQPDEALEEIKAVCAAIAAESSPFLLKIKGAGAFPKRGPLRTLWAGVSDGTVEWKDMVLKAQEPLAAFGVAREGGLAPHITLGRVKGVRGARRGDDNSGNALRAALAAEAGTECGTQTADRIALIQSTLDPRGAIHTPLQEWPLGQTLDKEQQSG